MLRFAVRRLFGLIPILLGLSIILFAWIRALPGGPAVALLGERATPEKIAQINKLYGLDRPIWEQYLKFLGRAVRGDLGVSIKSQRPVMEEWWDRFPATIELSVSAGLIALIIGLPLGYAAARRHGGWFDNGAVAGSLLGVAIPVFFLGYMLKYVFAVKLGWLPADGRQDPRLFSDHPTGLYVLDGLITGRPDAAWDAFLHLILPAITLASIPLAVITRITRAAVLDVVNEDYVRTAEAKGLTKRTISRRHVVPHSKRCCSDQEIVRPHRRASRREIGRETRVYTRNQEVERDQGQLREESLDEHLPPVTLGRFRRSVDSVQKLRRRDRCNGDRLVTVVAKHALQVELAPLRRDEHARVDHRSHGVSGSVGWLLAISSTASR